MALVHAGRIGTTSPGNVVRGRSGAQQCCSIPSIGTRIAQQPWGLLAAHHARGQAPRDACRTHALSNWWPFPQGQASTAEAPPTQQQQQKQRQQQGAARRSVVQEVMAEELLARVRQHYSSTAAAPLILMFTAEWCGPCTLVHKELTKLGALRPSGSFTVLSLDVDGSEENSKLASELGIYTLPTLIFVGKDEGKPSISTTGNVSITLVADVLDNKMSVCGGSLKNRLRM